MPKIGYTDNMIINTATGVGTQATITVYDAGTANKSTIYSDPVGTAKTNPFQTDANGRFNFYADEGEYDIQVSGAGIATYKIEDVSIIGYGSEFLKGEYDPIYKLFLIED